MRAIIAVLMISLAGAGCSADPAGPAMPRQAVLVGMETVLASSAWSGYVDPERRVIASDDDWAAVWAQIYDGQSPMPDRPAVDFESEVVILAAMGIRPSTGYAVTITEVRVHEGEFWVRVTERSPGRSCVTGDAVTSPVHAVRAPREAASAQFVMTRLETRC